MSIEGHRECRGWVKSGSQPSLLAKQLKYHAVWTRKLILFAVKHWNAADVGEDESEETKDKRCLSHIIPRSCTGRFHVFDEHLRPTNEFWFDVSPLRTHLDEHLLQTHLGQKPYLHYERIQPMSSCPKSLSSKRKRKHISLSKDGIGLGELHQTIARRLCQL